MLQISMSKLSLKVLLGMFATWLWLIWFPPAYANEADTIMITDFKFERADQTGAT